MYKATMYDGYLFVCNERESSIKSIKKNMRQMKMRFDFYKKKKLRFGVSNV